ncbi:MAG: hypothetical protein JJE08_06670 [Proteiniphilum sp.]|nr:hypothetical protein [Proteiniphilum sp.]
MGWNKRHSRYQNTCVEYPLQNEIGSPLFEKTVIDLGEQYGRGAAPGSWS